MAGLALLARRRRARRRQGGPPPHPSARAAIRGLDPEARPPLPHRGPATAALRAGPDRPLSQEPRPKPIATTARRGRPRAAHPVQDPWSTERVSSRARSPVRRHRPSRRLAALRGRPPARARPGPRRASRRPLARGTTISQSMNLI